MENKLHPVVISPPCEWKGNNTEMGVRRLRLVLALYLVLMSDLEQVRYFLAILVFFSLLEDNILVIHFKIHLSQEEKWTATSLFFLLWRSHSIL